MLLLTNLNHFLLEQNAEGRADTLAVEVDEQNIVSDREFREMLQVSQHEVVIGNPTTYSSVMPEGGAKLCSCFEGLAEEDKD